MGNKPITLSRAIELYFRSDAMRQAAKGTQDQHRRTLDALIRTCGPSRSVALMTADDFSSTIAQLSSRPDDAELAAARARRTGAGGVRRGRSEESLNIDRSVLRRFVQFLHIAGHLAQANNPALSLKTAKKERMHGHKRQPMLKDAVIALMDLAGDYHPRERVAVALAVLAGLRESEIQKLEWRDVRWDATGGPMLNFFRPKGRERHRVTLIPTLERELRAWHAFYAARHPAMNPSWYVVPTRKRGNMPGGKAGRGMSPDWPLVPDKKMTRRLRTIIKPMMAEVGVQDLYGKGMHTLRRTYANALLEHTNDIRVVQNALGHSSQVTTEIYLDKDHDFEVARAAMRDWDPFKRTVTDGNVIPLRRIVGER